MTRKANQPGNDSEGEEDRNWLTFLKHLLYKKKATDCSFTAILMSLMSADAVEAASTRTAQEKEWEANGDLCEESEMDKVKLSGGVVRK